MLGLVTTKVICLTSLGAGSLALGLLPLWLSGNRARKDVRDGADCPRHAAAAGPLLTALLSFGAGALLATAVVHMLAEASEDLPRAAPVSMLAGFLAMYLVDELVQKVLGHSLQRRAPIARSHILRVQWTNRARPWRPVKPSGKCAVQTTARCTRWTSQSSWKGESGEATEAVCLLSGPSTGPYRAADPTPAKGKQMASASFEAGGAGQASCWGLLLALSIHSIIEGLAVGLEDTPQQVIFLLGAVSSHKLVVSFCLGAELVGGGVALIPHLVAVLVFAGGSAAGVGVGMALYDIPGASSVASDPLLVPALQASAAGTLVYVTLAEVLPRERSRSQHNFPRRMLQFISFTVGAALITALVLLMDDHHNITEEPLGPR